MLRVTSECVTCAATCFDNRVRRQSRSPYIGRAFQPVSNMPEGWMIRVQAGCKLQGEDMAHAIDTLRIARKLESAGVDRRHAEAHAEALNEVVVTEHSELATKTDLERCATKVDLERFATKEDLERFATKADLERFATKEDLERFATKEDLERFATKADLERFVTKEYLHEVLKNFATKADLERFVTKEYLHEALKNFATKEDLATLETRMIRLWAVSTVTLATLIISMPFVAG